MIDWFLVIAVPLALVALIALGLLMVVAVGIIFGLVNEILG